MVFPSWQLKENHFLFILWDSPIMRSLNICLRKFGKRTYAHIKCTCSHPCIFPTYKQLQRCSFEDPMKVSVSGGNTFPGMFKSNKMLCLRVCQLTCVDISLLYLLTIFLDLNLTWKSHVNNERLSLASHSYSRTHFVTGWVFNVIWWQVTHSILFDTYFRTDKL